MGSLYYSSVVTFFELKGSFPMDAIYPLIALAILILAALGWMFYSDKIVRFIGWETDEDPSWTFGSSNK